MQWGVHILGRHNVWYDAWRRPLWPQRQNPKSLSSRRSWRECVSNRNGGRQPRFDRTHQALEQKVHLGERAVVYQHDLRLVDVLAEECGLEKGTTVPARVLGGRGVS